MEYHNITYEEFKNKIINKDFIFDGYRFSEFFYSGITANRPDFIEFGNQICDIIHIYSREQIKQDIKITIKNCIFDVITSFNFEKLPNTSIIRIRNCVFKNSCSFKDLSIKTEEREAGFNYSLNYCFFDKIIFSNVKFENINFKTSTIFNNVEFNGITTFLKCTFEEALIDYASVFKRDVIVIGSVFKGKCEFRCIFEKDLYLMESNEPKINDNNEIEENIIQTRFEANTFLGGEFHGSIIIKEVVFHENLIFRPRLMREINLENVDFKKVGEFRDLTFGSNTIFKKIDLSKVSLLYSKFLRPLFCSLVPSKSIFLLHFF